MKNKVYGTLRSDFEDEIEESAWGIGQVGEKHQISQRNRLFLG
jgi:hypothetical protein